MAQIISNAVKTIKCERIGGSASLIEKRAYMSDSLAANGIPGYQVLERSCSHSIECNLAGCSCCWSYLNPDWDPFEVDASDVQKCKLVC